MINRESPTIAECDSDGCPNTVSNTGLNLVDFQHEIASQGWFWYVNYEDVHSYCPNHKGEATPNT